MGCRILFIGEISMIIKLNPQFKIRYGEDCAYLVKLDGTIEGIDSYYINPVTILPPSLGYILDAIGQNEYSKSLAVLSQNLQVSIESINHFVKKITNNVAQEILIHSRKVIIPPNILLPSNNPCKEKPFYPSYKSVKFIERRPKHPLTMNLMVTTRCTTDCSYCYAKKKFQYELTLDEIVKIIDECHTIGVVNLSLTGGDIFAMGGWEKILLCTKKNGYSPFLSTKTPLRTKDICFLRSIGIEYLQFSLDSVSPKILSKMIKANGMYLQDVERMLYDFDKKGINISIRSVLCKQNACLSEITDLYNFLRKFKCIKSWILTPAFFSEFKNKYKQYEVSNEQLIIINKYINSLHSKFPIAFNKVASDGYQLKRSRTVEDFVCHNQTCNANSFSMSILASGECTVCEMLYENKEYLLGNVRTDNILDIWNSKKAMSLYSPHQGDILKSSPCSKCKVFENCKGALGKKICYVDIAKVNKDAQSFSMPDPRCPMSKNIDLIL